MLVLKRVLQERGLSQSGFARELDVSPATVAQLVNHGYPYAQVFDDRS